MSNKTATLTINTGQYSINGEYSWYDYRDLYAGRDSDGQYWFSKLSFNTNGLKIKKSTTLTISHTLRGTSNPYGTSAILTTSELTPNQVHALTTEANVIAVSGYIAYTHCDSHTSSANQSSGTVITYTFDTDKLKSDITYYIYIKRRVGLSNSTSSSPNGWTEYYNPCYSDSYASYSSLSLTYESGGCVNIRNGSEFKKYAVYIYSDGKYKRYAPYVYKGSQWVPCN
jgi:hypothetical protein